ncbi:PucR family transcriptional regulator [Microbacterium sp.]|uniref:PucR family transcriptional regulator n=1 Tax=Microbacterium sp. TaxID=51671 RepID=UPI002B598337|nr:PucR family transcriptional regulator [Microbacterium sp.]HWK78058.1 PucR family transcriptional regulator [Microbacterium sp.]
MDHPTLRALLGRRDLGLRLVGDEANLDDGALDQPLRWVHSSDLVDPTPFLADDLTLLTTGSQFAEDEADEYVARLAARGILGLGFGTGVRRPQVPDRLIDACARASIPLFEVPYDTPFIAIARAHAEAIAAQTYARRTWALDAQRALAIAALRPRGLESTLSELARRLEHWVGMFDATGLLVHEHPHEALHPDDLAGLTARATELITRGGQAGQSLTLGTDSFTLFTLGRTGHLRGVIAIGTASLDAEARAVVTSVIAMAGLALEQNEQLDRSRRRLRSQVLASLLLDDPTLARRVLGSVPPAPIVIAIADADAPADAIADWWERRRADHGTAVFGGMSDAGITMVVSAEDVGLFDELAERFGIRLGVSDPETYDAFSRAHAKANAALRHRGGRAVDGTVHYSDTVATSILSTLVTDDARLVAESRLAPMRADGRELEASLRTWLQHDARFESAAAELGIHRHTLRSRVTQASRLLDTDLSTFPARAELWALLQASPAS